MRCPFCGTDDTQVKDSRPTDDRGAIRRRRFCPSCAARFTTFERVQLRELTVVKKNGQREPFDRDKLARSIYVAIRKRPVEPDRVERAFVCECGDPACDADLVLTVGEARARSAYAPGHGPGAPQ